MGESVSVGERSIGSPGIPPGRGGMGEPQPSGGQRGSWDASVLGPECLEGWRGMESFGSGLPQSLYSALVFLSFSSYHHDTQNISWEGGRQGGAKMGLLISSPFIIIICPGTPRQRGVVGHGPLGVSLSHGQACLYLRCLGPRKSIYVYMCAHVYTNVGREDVRGDPVTYLLLC